MRIFVLCAASFALIAAAAPAVPKQNASASSVARATCDARYYDYLVGKNLDEARNIGTTNYRVLAQGARPGAADPRRMTVVVDKMNLIVYVACG